VFRVLVIEMDMAVSLLVMRGLYAGLATAPLDSAMAATS
jgi:hypothetical protein